MSRAKPYRAARARARTPEHAGIAAAFPAHDRPRLITGDGDGCAVAAPRRRDAERHVLARPIPGGCAWGGQWRTRRDLEAIRPRSDGFRLLAGCPATGES